MKPCSELYVDMKEEDANKPASKYSEIGMVSTTPSNQATNGSVKEGNGSATQELSPS